MPAPETHGPRHLTRDQRRSLAYNRAVVVALRREPSRVLHLARRNLDRLRAQHPHASRTWDLWERALALPLHLLCERMLDTDYDACEMRHASPFAGAIDRATRLHALRAFQAEEARR